MLIALGGVAIFRRTRRSMVLIAAGAIAVLQLTQSRGSLVAVIVIVCAAIYAAIASSKATRFESSAFAALLVTACAITAFALPALVTSSLWASMSAALSDATRSVWSLVAANTLWQYPAGQGYAAPGVLLRGQVGEAAQALSRSFPLSDMRESIQVSLDPNGNSLAPKTLPALC